MEFRQLLAEPATIELGALLDTLQLRDRALLERPYTLANFVSSVDGRATFQGRSGRLGDDGDRAVFHGLREHVDAILAGTTTMRIENYGRLIRDPERRARRVARGLEPEPLACIVSRSGDVPTGIPLFADPDSRIVVFTATSIDVNRCAAQVEVIRLDPGKDMLATAMRLLRTTHGMRSLLCEGGPTLFGALVRENLVDELFLTLAPKLVGGGDGPTITHGPELPELQQLSPVWALERSGALFLRYALGRPHA